MRLEKITFVFMMCWISEAISRNLRQDFPFPPSFQTPQTHSSDSSLYLPLETQTSIPYFPLKTTNDLQYEYLPLTGTKSPTIYPSPLSLSSYFSNEPIIDEEDKNYALVNTKTQFSSTRSPPTIKPYSNMTQNIPDSEMVIEKKETRHLPKMVAHGHPIDRIVSKTFIPTQAPFKVPMADRRVIKSTEEVRSDLVNGDQTKTEAQHERQYFPLTVDFVPTTPETAIPILRLSNEMDLDGSYSYEALGADQTHYVQHSRMENVGTDNEEQVVEGSYSYVGDNGQTYTVHYIADGNGFRASGEHLPVPPPIPEIIQRSIQYNLAEEVNNPTHLKTWDQEEKYSNVFDNINLQTAASINRNLFTGRKPEAFSRNFVKHINTQDLTIQPAPSSSAPIETQYKFKKEQTEHSKQNKPITPQITFTASQGAHIPLISSPQPEVLRIQPDSEKEMSKLVRYGMERNDNTPQESTNKQLWRWQYGMTTNPEKTSISRSSSENDDNIVINFKDMTPEQYSNTFHSQFDLNGNYASQNKVFENPHNKIFNKVPNHQINHEGNTNYGTMNSFSPLNEHTETKNSEEFLPYSSDWFRKTYTNSNIQNLSFAPDERANAMKKHNLQKSPAKTLITEDNLTPQTQTGTQSYSYRNVTHNRNNLKSYDTKIDKSFNYKKQDQTQYRSINASHNDASEHAVSLTFESTTQRNDIKSIRVATPTTENTLDVLRNNIFLKRLLLHNTTKSGHDAYSGSMQLFNTVEATTRITPKMINSDYNNYNDIRIIKRKPQNVAEMLNFLSSRNAFESNKIKSKKRHYERPNFDVSTEHDNTYLLDEFKSNTNENNYNYLNDEQNERLRGIVKIYKTLQRSNNAEVAPNDKGIESRRDVSTDFEPIPSHKLPSLGRAGPSVRSYSPAS